MSNIPTDQCAHSDAVCNLVDRFQQWKGYECPYCTIERLEQRVKWLEDYSAAQENEISRARRALDVPSPQTTSDAGTCPKCGEKLVDGHHVDNDPPPLY